MLMNDAAEKLKEVVDATTSCVELSVDKDFDVTTVVKINPKDPSMATVNNVIKEKGERRGKAEKQLTVTIDIDKKTNLFHVMIVNVDKFNTNILFTATEENPIQKIEKYLPNIINSTQNILLTQVTTKPEKKVFVQRNRDNNRGNRERKYDGRKYEGRQTRYSNF
jgi:hypothetical protein